MSSHRKSAAYPPIKGRETSARGLGRKEPIVATRTRTAAKTVVVSKSAHLRTLLTEAEAAGTLKGSLATLATKARMGYAFAYGVASRFPHPDGGTYADRAANRRQTKSVQVVGSVVHVAIVNEAGEYTGKVLVDMTTGKVTRTK